MKWKNQFNGLYREWMKLSKMMGLVMSTFWLGLFYLLVLTPLGLMWRIFGHDPLRLKWNEFQESYREEVDQLDLQHMEKPF